MKLSNFKYPKLVGLITAIILAYLIFRNPHIKYFVSGLGSLKYLGIFIAGLLFAFGFTAPFAAGFFITLNPENILIAGIIGGLGALYSDLLIFSSIRVSFEKEFKRLRKTKLIREIKDQLDKSFGKRIKICLLYALIGIIIASPLPDELGVIMLAGLTKVRLKILFIVSFILNTLGIIILLAI